MAINAQKSLFVFCGEHSGDMHGAKLVQALKQRLPGLSIQGVAGPRMRAAGVDPFLQMERFAVMGFTDVLLALPRLIGLFKKIRTHILTHQPAAVILIDYPEFNLLLCKSLKKGGYTGKIIQYISPTVWAWRQKRSDTLAKYCDMLLIIYPFELKCYAHTSLDVRYVGNPTQSTIAKHQYHPHWKSSYRLPPSIPLLAVFPGSRAKEIELNLPKQMAALEKLYAENPNFHVAISLTDHAHRERVLKILSKFSFVLEKNVFLIDRRHTYELMKDCELAVAKSGTVTLELALHHKPTVVIYEISTINKLIAKYLLRIHLPYYTIANILLNEEVFPELVDANISETEIFAKIKALRSNPDVYHKTSELCRKIDALLTNAAAEENASEAILEVL